MKKTLKCFAAFFASAFILFISVIPFSSRTVSALSSDGLIYSAENPNVSLDFMKDSMRRLQSNSSLSSINLANSVIYIHFFGPTNVRVVIIPDGYTTINKSGSDGKFTYYFPFTSSNNFINHIGSELRNDDLATYNFPLRTTSHEYNFVAINDNYIDISNTKDTTCGFTAYSRNPTFTGSIPSSFYTYKGNFICYLPDPVYNPVIMPLYEAVYSLNIQKEEFIKWLIDNERYVDIADGLIENRVSGFVDIFQKYGANNKAFSFNVKQFFDFIGIGQTISDYGAVLEKTRSLYREYQQYVRFQLMEHYNNKVKDTLNIKPVTNDNNISLITDSADDTLVIRLLRDILRSLIALPVNIGDLMQTLELKVDGLENTVNITNDSGLPDFSTLWTYSNNDFDDDLMNFYLDVSEVQQLPLTYLTNINENPLMPEKMLNDKDNLTVNIPNISGFTVSNDGKSFSTQTTSYAISSNDYPWLDPLVKKIKRFSGILLILGYLVSLRYRLPEIVRGE